MKYPKRWFGTDDLYNTFKCRWCLVSIIIQSPVSDMES